MYPQHTTDERLFSPHIPRDLQPGEFQLFCGQCGWKCEKNAVGVNQCGGCGHWGLLVASERKQT